MNFYNSASIKQCNFCQKRIVNNAIFTCPECLCTIYCSKQCLENDLEAPFNTDHSHKLWCMRMKEFMLLEKPLSKLPFKFVSETTSSNFDMLKYTQFLMSNGVIGKGMWRRECPFFEQSSDEFYGLDGIEMPGDALVHPSDYDQNCPFVLPTESILLSLPPDESSTNTDSKCTDLYDTPLQDWEQYYNWRGINLNSSIAILLQWPLTMYYIFTSLFTKTYPNRYKSIKRSKKLSIHIVGAEKEVELLTAFQELEYLLPNLTIILTFVGIELSTKVNGFTKIQKPIHYHVVRGAYHRLPENVILEDPDIIIGFNSGLSAYLTWTETLILIRKLDVPSYFTDLCPYSCSCSFSLAERMNIGPGEYAQRRVINPFRSPIRVLSDSHYLPWFSNAFIITPLYSPPDVEPILDESPLTVPVNEDQMEKS